MPRLRLHDGDGGQEPSVPGMTVMHKLDDAVRGILERSTVEGGVLKLPQQLDRPTYVSVDKALKAIGGKWDRKAGGHVFPFDPTELLAGAVEDGEVVDRKKTLQFFETPADLVATMLSFIDFDTCRTILEPSAGHGAIARQLVGEDVQVVAVEVDPANADVLRAAVPTAKVVVEDFLTYALSAVERFDAVVMNPPFTKFQDVAHIRAAFGLLASGGVLIAICSESPFFREDRSAVEFRAWLDENDAYVRRLDPGTFASSGTGVNTRLVVVRI